MRGGRRFLRAPGAPPVGLELGGGRRGVHAAAGQGRAGEHLKGRSLGRRVRSTPPERRTSVASGRGVRRLTGGLMPRNLFSRPLPGGGPMRLPLSPGGDPETADYSAPGPCGPRGPRRWAAARPIIARRCHGARRSSRPLPSPGGARRGARSVCPAPSRVAPLRDLWHRWGMIGRDRSADARPARGRRGTANPAPGTAAP